MKSRRLVRWMVSALLLVGAVVAIRLFGGSDTVKHDGLTFAAAPLARGLERGVNGKDLRILAKFTEGDGAPCRAFLGAGTSGIACREHGGWHLRVIRNGVSLDDPADVANTERALRQAVAGMTGQ